MKSNPLYMLKENINRGRYLPYFFNSEKKDYYLVLIFYLSLLYTLNYNLTQNFLPYPFAYNSFFLLVLSKIILQS